MSHKKQTLEQAQAAMRERHKPKPTEVTPKPRPQAKRKRQSVSQRLAHNRLYCRAYYREHLGKERAARRAEREAAKQLELMAARAERKRIKTAKRCKRYRARKKANAYAMHLAECSAKRAQLLAAKLERERLQELNRRKHASRKEGFLAGWAAKADLTPEQEEQWSTRYKNGFKHARTERKRFEAQTSGA
jgi:hypothetical protein